jgi:outer membrane protein TolC
MPRTHWRRWLSVALLTLPAFACKGAGDPFALDPAPPPHPVQVSDAPPPAPLAPPEPADGDAPFPINLPTALRLAGAQPLDIALASERIRLAVAVEDRARVLWLPTILAGADYFRHDGQIQDVAGKVFGTSRGALLAGASPLAVFAVTDALFAPLAARQEVRARQAELQAARNDSLLAVAEAYFNVQQARGELAGAEDAVRRAEELVRRTANLTKSLVAPVDEDRARTELARRRQAVDAARERWQTASAELARVLRLDAAAVVQPLEPPHLRVTLVSPDLPVDELIPVALTNRPELAAQQALVQATLERLRQEKLRPLIPSVLLRGASTTPTGTLGAGVFGGGLNDSLSNFSARMDLDILLLWELQNLGLGNRALVDARRAENRLAVVELFRVQDRVAAEVAQAHAQVRSAARRAVQAEAEVKTALSTVTRSFEGMENTVKDKAGNAIALVIRPQESVAAVQALAQAYGDFYAAVAEYDRAQFRLYRALGHPAEAITAQPADCPAPTPTEAPAGSPPPSPGEVSRP